MKIYYYHTPPIHETGDEREFNSEHYSCELSEIQAEMIRTYRK